MIDSNEIKTIFSKKILEKRAARILCVQSIYALIISDTIQNPDPTLLKIINTHQEQEDDIIIKDVNYKYLIHTARFYAENKEFIDSMVSRHLSSDWSVSRLPILVYSIISAAASEIYLDKEIDKKIVINDYLEIAKIFNHDGEVGFINKILDNI